MRLGSHCRLTRSSSTCRCVCDGFESRLNNPSKRINVKSWCRGMRSKIFKTHYHEQLGLPDKTREITELVVCWVLFKLLPRVFGQEMRDWLPFVTLNCVTS